MMAFAPYLIDLSDDDNTHFPHIVWAYSPVEAANLVEPLLSGWEDPAGVRILIRRLNAADVRALAATATPIQFTVPKSPKPSRRKTS